MAADADATPEVVRPRSATTAATCSSAPAHAARQDGEAQDLFDSLGAQFKAAGLNDGELRVKRSRVGCFAACKGGPVMCVQPDGTWYYNVTPANMDRIITEHLVGGLPVQELVFHQGPAGG